MMAISFAWTSAALVAGHKTVTRRAWKPEYAAKFRPGGLVEALDRDRRVGGKVIGTLRIVSVEYRRMAEMPLSDYEAEGLRWLYEHPAALPRDMPPYEASLPHFLTWKHAGGRMWVVRFEVVSLDPNMPPSLRRWAARRA